MKTSAGSGRVRARFCQSPPNFRRDRPMSRRSHMEIWPTSAGRLRASRDDFDGGETPTSGGAARAQVPSGGATALRRSCAEPGRHADHRAAARPARGKTRSAGVLRIGAGVAALAPDQMWRGNRMPHPQPRPAARPRTGQPVATAILPVHAVRRAGDVHFRRRLAARLALILRCATVKAALPGQGRARPLPEALASCTLQATRPSSCSKAVSGESCRTSSAMRSGRSAW